MEVSRREVVYTYVWVLRYPLEDLQNPIIVVGSGLDVGSSGYESTFKPGNFEGAQLYVHVNGNHDDSPQQRHSRSISSQGMEA